MIEWATTCASNHRNRDGHVQHIYTKQKAERVGKDHWLIDEHVYVHSKNDSFAFTEPDTITRR